MGSPLSYFINQMSTDNLALRKAKVIITWLGLNPMHQSKLAKFYVRTYVTLVIIFIFLCIVKIMKVWSDIKMLAPTMESFSVFIHCSGKMTALIANQDRILELFLKEKRFWQDQKFPPVTLSQCNFIKQVLNLTTNTSLFMGHVVMILFFLNALLSSNKELPIIIYMPESIPYSLLAITEYIVCVITVEIMLITDVLFIALCVEAMIQLKLIGYNFEHIDYLDAPGDDLKTDIEHHNFILEYCSEIGKTATYSFFAMYAVCTLTTCFNLYIILESRDAHYYEFLRGLIYVSTLTLELSLYCVAAELLSMEIANVGDSVYKSDWYNSDSPRIRRMIILILLRTQKQKDLRAGGMVTINMPTFLNVFKMAFSFFSCMKAVSV